MSISDAQFARWLRQDARSRVILAEVGCNRAGEEITRYLSDVGYTGDDHVTYRARIARGVEFTRQLAVTPGESAVSVSYGDLMLDNGDGMLSSWLDDVWEKRPIRVYLGDASWPRADFRQLFAGRIKGVKPRRGEIALSIYDELERLNFPVSELLLGGDSDNKNALIPLSFGECFNVLPLLINEGEHQYQYNAGPTEKLLEVRDNGDALKSWVTDIINGTFKLNQQPIGQITCDVQGARAGKTSGGAWLKTVAGIVRELATQYGDGNLRLTAAEIDAAVFNQFDAANPQPVGLYLSDKTNVIDAVDALCRSIGASVYFGRDHKLKIWRLPSMDALIAAPARDIGAGDYEHDSFEAAEVVPAVPAVKLSWGRNWTPTESGLADGLPESSRAEFKKEVEESAHNDPERVALHRYTTVPEVEETLLVREADALAEAARRLALRARPRKIYRVTAYAAAFLLDLGQVVRLAEPTPSEKWHKGVVVGLVDDTGADRVTVEILTLPEAP